MPVLACWVLFILRIQIRVLEYGCCHTKVTRVSRVVIFWPLRSSSSVCVESGGLCRDTFHLLSLQIFLIWEYIVEVGGVGKIQTLGTLGKPLSLGFNGKDQVVIRAERL